MISPKSILTFPDFTAFSKRSSNYKRCTEILMKACLNYSYHIFHTPIAKKGQISPPHTYPLKLLFALSKHRQHIVPSLVED